jgi:hypothetical protein
VADPAGLGQALPGGFVAVVAAVLPVRVAGDRPPGGGRQRHHLWVESGGGRDRDYPVDPVRVAPGPLDDVHPADAPADDGVQTVDPEMVEQSSLGASPVADRHRREIRSVGPPGLGVGARRAGGAVTRPGDVRTDDVVPVGVDELLGTDDVRPPAVGLVHAGGVVVPGRHLRAAGKRVTDEYRRVVGVTVGLVGNL